MDKNLVAFIPARIGSKGIPKKNIKILGDKPLIAWSIEVAFKAGIERVIVNTDSEEIGEIARKYGAEVMIRPQNLAQDKTSMFEVLAKEVPKIKNNPELILLLQPTNPFRKKIHIKIALQYFTENLKKYDSLISVEKVPEKWNPYAMILENKRMIFRKLIGIKEKLQSLITGRKYIKSLSGFPINQRMMRRQDLPSCWLPTGSIYIFKAENLKKGSIYGEESMLYETEPEMNINTLEDWNLAEEFLNNKDAK